jgi:hypothetical protein
MTTAAMKIRYALCDYATWAVAHRDRFDYAEIRPIPDMGKDDVRKLPITTDCSGFVTILYKWAGAPDPNGEGYDGSGYTGTLLSHLPHISKADAWRGDLIVIGPGTGYHVVMLMESGEHENPRVVSHGTQGDPNFYSLDQQLDYFGTGVEVRYLRGVNNQMTGIVRTRQDVG